MGNCLSVDPDMRIWAWVDEHIDVVECDRCHRRADRPWSSLSQREKAKSWRVVVLEHTHASLARGAASLGSSSSGERDLSRKQSTPFLIMCATCSDEYRAELEQFRKERQYYAQAKGMLYPKQRLQTALRRIETDERWDHGASFHATYRPNSMLEGLGDGCLACGVGDVGGVGGVGDVDSMLRQEAGVTLVQEDSIEYEDDEEEEEEEEGRRKEEDTTTTEKT